MDLMYFFVFLTFVRFEVKDIVTTNAEDVKFLAEKYKDQEAIKVRK